MRAFEYATVTGLDEAVALLSAADGASAVRPLAGGTDMLPLMKADVVRPERLIDVKHVPELGGGIRSVADGVEIGALTTLSQVESSPLLRATYPALVEAVGQAATPQLRNMATLGGNLLQRPRCWYFRSSHFNCWLKGGGECHAREGENQLHAIFDESPCVAVHASDPPGALLAFGASVLLSSGRAVPLAEFFTLPTEAHRTENVLQPGELVTGVRLPADGVRSTYRKAMNRKVWAFALVGVAAAVRFDGDRVQSARLVLNGVAPIPWRAHAAEDALVGGVLDDAAIGKAADAALRDARPLRNNGYKIPLARGLIRQALNGLREG